MTPSFILEKIVTETGNPVKACVIWLHGLGADGHDFDEIPSQLQIPQQIGVRFIFPHAPFRSVTLNNGYKMRAWYDIFSLNDLHREDGSGIKNSEQAVAQLILEQRSAGIPASRIFLGGFSQGGAMALHTGLRYPERLGGILGLSTYLPLMSQFNAAEHRENHQPPVFLAHGEQDNILPLSLGVKTRDYLMHAGYSVEWRQYPMAHQVCLTEIADIRQWLQNILTLS